MNQKHVDTDHIVELGNATDWTLRPIDHMGSCEHCRNEFLEMAAVRSALSGTDPLPAPTIDTIVQRAVQAAPPSTEARGSSYDWAAKALTPLLATAAAILVVLMSG